MVGGGGSINWAFVLLLKTSVSSSIHSFQVIYIKPATQDPLKGMIDLVNNWLKLFYLLKLFSSIPKAIRQT